MEGNKSEAIIHKLEKISYPSKNHQPKEVIFIEKIPRIPNGKVDRRELSKIIDNRLKK
jgi:O-succinylbenzoic acid--CoA ligase